MEQKPTYYITTPIYYPSNKLHIGHSYCTVAADTLARYKRLRGYDVYFLTGTDEHGQKIERRAKEAGKTPQQFVDEIVEGIEALWKLMDISNNDFLRTTQPRHVKAVQRIFRQLYEMGHIYKGHYEGWYCTPCESYWTQTQLQDGKCPDCGRAVERTQEEAYFLRLSHYQDWMLQYIHDHPDFIQPASRANEMIKNFIEPGLEDLCVSRTSFSWGVPVDFDPSHVVYVWVDALSNYITALGYDTADDSLYRRYWPADLHLVGKEITRFHTIVWPIMLQMLGLPLPKQVMGHGWLVIDGVRMAKSRGNVVDPVVLVNRYGADAIRYFLMREMPLGSDGQYTHELLINRINADLANDLGNLLHRTIAMIGKYFNGVIPAPGPAGAEDEALLDLAKALPGEYGQQMDALQIHTALASVWRLVGECNRYIDVTAPWVLARTEADRPRLGTVLYNLAEALRIIAVLISPVMTRTPGAIMDQLAVDDPALQSWDSVLHFGGLRPGAAVRPAPALFPRLDLQVEMETLAPPPAAIEEPADAPAKAEIAYDDFAKIDLRLALVTACEPVPKSKKLLRLTLKVGGQTRTVVSGIAGSYSAAQMVGKQVVLVYNLKPAKLMGELSEGMILCGEGPDGVLKLITAEDGLPDGAGIR